MDHLQKKTNKGVIKMFALDAATTERLQQISDDLNEKSTALTDGFIEVETMLADLKLGVTAWASEPIVDRGTTYIFGFCKIKNEWRLVCKKEDIDNADKIHNSYGLLKTISYMPRHIRIEAANRLEDLVQQIISKAESFNTDISNALDNIKGATEKVLV